MVPNSRTTKTELQVLRDRSTPHFDAVLSDLTAAMVNHDLEAHARALEQLNGLFRRVLILSDLLGRRRIMLEVNSRRRAKNFADTPDEPEMPDLHPDWGENPVVPHVKFDEAIQDIVKRMPWDPQGVALGYKKVQEIYHSHYTFALAKAADLELAQRVQSEIARMFAEGISVPKASEVIARTGKWRESYGQTVYLTNLATAYSAGRHEQARDPDVREIANAFEYTAVRDPLARPHHLAAHGLIADTQDPIWETYSPPLGYNCRCSLRLVDKWELAKKGILRDNRVITWKPARFNLAHPDPGFGPGRPYLTA